MPSVAVIAPSTLVDEVAALLAEPGALELLKAYANLPRGVSRSALVEFVRTRGGNLGSTHIVGFEDDLSLQVAVVHYIKIHDAYCPHAGSGKV